MVVTVTASGAKKNEKFLLLGRYLLISCLLKESFIQAYSVSRVSRRFQQQTALFLIYVADHFDKSRIKAPLYHDTSAYRRQCPNFPQQWGCI